MASKRDVDKQQCIEMLALSRPATTTGTLCFPISTLFL